MIHFQVYMEVVEMLVSLWVLTPCSDHMFCHFRETYCFL